MDGWIDRYPSYTQTFQPVHKYIRSVTYTENVCISYIIICALTYCRTLKDEYIALSNILKYISSSIYILFYSYGWVYIRKYIHIALSSIYILPHQVYLYLRMNTLHYLRMNTLHYLRMNTLHYLRMNTLTYCFSSILILKNEYT